MSTTLDDLRELADHVHWQRPDWSLGAILNVLHGQRERGTLEELRDAAERACLDATNKAPASIAFDRNWHTKTRSTAAKPNGRRLPLPECAECGQPRRRNHVAEDGTVTEAAKPKFCPACGVAWVDHQHTPIGGDAPATVACSACGHTQGAGFPRCTQCGAQLEVRAGTTPSVLAALKDRRVPHTDPVSFTEVIEHVHDVLADQLGEPTEGSET